MQDKNLTVGEVYEIQRTVFDEPDASNCTAKQLARRFLSKALISVDWSKNDKIFEDYREAFGDAEHPTEINEFLSHVGKTQLDLVKDPKDELLRLYRSATEDLGSISEHLKYIQAELETLKSLARLTTEQRYYRKQLEYFRLKNIGAREQIYNFLAGSIGQFAIESCREDRLGIRSFLNLRSPYPYAQKFFIFKNAPSAFDVRSVSSLSNKFGDLTVEGAREVRDLYNSDKEEFFTVAEQYISGHIDGFENAISKVRRMVAESYILRSREKIFSRLLQLFADGDYLTFVNILPLQIEGIFNDICVAIGVNQSELDISSINKKLELIEPEMRDFYYFEYYAFKFPVIRNRVAHGEVIDGDLRHTAIMLMLDLLPVCQLTFSDSIPFNRAIKLLRKASATLAVEDIYAWWLTRKAALPEGGDFVGLIEKVENAVVTCDFWNGLEEIYKSNRLPGRKELLKFAGELKVNGLGGSNPLEFLKKSSRMGIQADEEAAQRQAKIMSLLGKEKPSTGCEDSKAGE